MSTDDDSSGRKPYALPSVETKTKFGRPSKFNLEVFLDILLYLGKGMYQNEAAERAGINAGVLSEWKHDGWQIGCLDFAEAIKKATLDYQVSLIEKIEAHPSWQAKAWILERRWPRLFGQNRVPTPEETEGQDKKEEWFFKAPMGDRGYFVVPIGGTVDPVEAYHRATEHADPASTKPKKTE